MSSEILNGFSEELEKLSKTDPLKWKTLQQYPAGRVKRFLDKSKVVGMNRKGTKTKSKAELLVNQ